MPVNPIVVLLVEPDGTVTANRNNLGNDLKIVVTNNVTAFYEAQRGIPYEGDVE